MATGGMGTGGAAPTGAAPTGAAATGAVPTGATGGTGATGKEDPRLKTFKVPEKYAKDPWAREVKSVEDLWDKMAGANKLIGKDRIALPGENATPEELSAFYTKMGRPENAEGYEFKSIEDLKEVARNVDVDHGMKKIFFDEGVSKEAGEQIVSKYEALIYGMHKPLIEESAKREQDFTTLSDEVLGADKAAAMEAFKVVMKESLGDKAHLASKIESMDNDVLLPMIVLAKNIHDKYVGENRVISGTGGQPGLTGDLKADFQALSQQKLNLKLDKTTPEHIKKMKMQNLNTAIAKIGTAAKEKDIDLFA